MQVQEAIRLRKSVRSFRETAVEQDKIDRILEAARLAPSARNVQEWRFVVVTDRAMIRKITEQSTNGYGFVAEAPLLFVVCAVTDKAVMSCGHARYAVDCAIAIDHMTLAAVEEGLGTCWIGGFRQAPVKELLGIPDDVEVFELLPTGYPTDPSPVEKRRKPLSELVCYDSWKL